jgi:hypothetical protein
VCGERAPFIIWVFPALLAARAGKVSNVEQSAPLEEVSKLLGHESIKTTERHYSKWMKGRQDRLDSLVTGTWKLTERQWEGSTDFMFGKISFSCVSILTVFSCLKSAG